MRYEEGEMAPTVKMFDALSRVREDHWAGPMTQQEIIQAAIEKWLGKMTGNEE
jgi:hypothetical protein